MDVLKDPEKKTYDYISRYAPFTFYYHTKDEKYIYEITDQLNDNIIFVAHKISQKDTLDSLAEHYYGRPDLYWIIADFNRIQDPFVELWGNYEVLKIPTITNISYRR